jgi:hypothetical protein
LLPKVSICEVAMNRQRLMVKRGEYDSSLEYYQQVKSLLGTSLVAHYPFWDASGAVAVDISGNARNAAYVGTPVLSATGIGDGRTSVNFNAAGEVNAYTAGLAGALDAGNFFAGWWTAANDAASYPAATLYAFCFFGASATMYYQSRKNSDGTTISFISRRGGTIVTLSTNVPTTTRLYHLAMIGDGANDRLIGYVNGTRQKPLPTLGTWSGAFANPYMQIGDTSPAVGNNNWPGRMAHYTLANAIPTDATIRTLAQQNGQVIFDGDSRSLNKGWHTAAVEAAFPSGLFAYGGRGVATWATTGNSTTTLLPEATLIELISGASKTTYVLWCGVNDGAVLTAQQIYDNLKNQCLLVRSLGGKAIICTEIDSQANMTWHNTVWPALNALLAADHAFADGYADLGARAELQNALDTTYYNADKIHLTAAGYAIVRDVVAPVIASVA